MKIKFHRLLIGLALLAALSQSLSAVRAQTYSQNSIVGTAFTYQGRLQNNGSPANGLYDFKFNIIDAPSGGTILAPTIITNAIAVSNGLFAVTMDFGQGIFIGPARWLEITVSSNSVNNFFTLGPRQQILPTPYAIFAGIANNVSGTVSATQVSGSLAQSQLPATVVTNGPNGVNLSGNLNLPAQTDSSGIIYAGGQALLHGDSLFNFFAGPNAGNLTMSGGNNSGFGYQALNSNTTGTNNTANGVNVLRDNTSGYDNTALGYDSLCFNTTGFDNTAGGGHALYSNTTGVENTAFGFDALIFNTTGYDNTANGAVALYFNTTGSFNTANGSSALVSNTTGSENTATGESALGGNINGSNNVADGAGALASNTSGNYNTADGANALLLNTVGYYNTANGCNALYYNTNGGYNTANGYAALYSNTSGLNDTAVGAQALYLNTIGYNNIGIGNYALGQVKTGVNNIAIGYQAGYNFTGTEFGNIDIGNVGVAGENNIVRIGSGQTKVIFPAGSTVYTGSVALTSDRNAKENFIAINTRAVLDKVATLPVTQWNYKTDSKSDQHIGPMAQDFQAAFGLDGNDDKHISVVDESGVALAAIQGLNQKVNEKNAEIQEMKARLEKLEQLVDAKNGE